MPTSRRRVLRKNGFPNVAAAASQCWWRWWCSWGWWQVMHACLHENIRLKCTYLQKTFKCARAWTMNGEWNNFCMEIFLDCRGLDWIMFEVIMLVLVWWYIAPEFCLFFSLWAWLSVTWRWWWMHDWDHVDDNNTFSYKVILEILHYFYLFLWNSTLIFILKEALTNHTMHNGPNWVIRLRIILYHCWEVDPIIILHCYKKVPFKGIWKTISHTFESLNKQEMGWDSQIIELTEYILFSYFSGVLGHSIKM